MEMEIDFNNDRPNSEITEEVADTSTGSRGKSFEDKEKEVNLTALSTKSSKISLKTTPKVKKEKSESSIFLDKLKKLLSSLYMDASARLCLKHFLRCAQDVSFCVSNHYSAIMPEVPSSTQEANLRCTWQQESYLEFIQTASDMCVRCEFPGEVIFAKLMELILTSKTSKHIYVSFIRVFRSFIHTFPPCWLDLRHRYIKFFRKNLHIPKLSSNNDDHVAKPNRVFEIVFSLLERTLEDYNEKILIVAETTNTEDHYQSNTHLNTSLPSLESSKWNWKNYNDSTNTFLKLRPDARLERLNVLLDLLLQILEIDLTMWLLHNYRKPKEVMYHTEKAPLVVFVFDMKQGLQTSTLVKRLFIIFSKSIALNLNQTHLKILERYIALIMVKSHTADIENSIMGIRYPSLQANTKGLIKNFYDVFKLHNKTSLKPFLKVIDLLRIPYVKFEFIDHFLNAFHHTPGIPMSPAKIKSDLAKDYAAKYKLEAEIKNQDDDLSREEFFALLLKSFRAYCQMYGLQQVMRFITTDEIFQPLQTVSNSVHRYPNRGRTADVFSLTNMSEDMDVWVKQLRMQVRMSRPKIDFSVADICIDKHVLASYRTDLKYCCLLADIIHKYAQKNNDINLTEWLEFIKQFKKEKKEKG